MMTKKLLWAAGIFLALVLVIVLGLSLFVKSYLKSERLKSIIIPKAEEFTGRKVSIDQIHVSLFKGIIVKGISLKEADGTSDFITTKEFILDYNLIPLLRKEIMIKRIEVVSPNIIIKREDGGKFNFSDIAQRQHETKKTAGAGEEKEKGFPLSVITDRISVRDAKVAFTDRAKELPDMAARADIELMLSAGRDLKEITGSGNLDLKELTVTVSGLQTMTSGKVELKGDSIQMNLNTALGKDSIKLTGIVKDYLKSPDITLNISATELDIEKLIPLTGKKKAGEASSKGKSVAPQKEERKQGAKADSMRASGEITINAVRYKDYTVKEFSMHYQYRDGIVTVDPLSMYVAGGDQIKMDGSVKGKLRYDYASGKTYSASGYLDLKELKVAANTMQTSTSGRIEMDGETIRVNLTTAEGKESIKLSGTVRDYLKSPDVKLDLYARELDLEKLIVPGNVKKGDKESSKGKGPVADKKQSVKSDGIKASGEVKVDAARYKGYTMKNFLMNYRYKDDVVTIEPMRMNLTGGDQVKTEGTLKGNIQFNAASDIKKTITGKGSLDLSKCEVRESKISDTIALFTGLEDLRRPRFDSVKMNFTMREEKVSLDGTMNSNLLKLNPTGSIDFDQRIDMITDLKLSPALASKLPTAKVTGFMRDEKGWDTIPLKITGTVEKPSVTLNQAALGKQIERGITGEIEKRLFKGTPEKKGGQPSKEKGPQDLLKGIFGK